MARPSNLSAHFTPSFPTPAIIGAQASQALFQENQWEASIVARAPQLGHGHPNAADTLVPPPAAVAPQTFQFQPESQRPHWTMPQAAVPNAMPFQHFSGKAAAVQPPLHGNELAARVAAINTLPYQPFQPNNNYAHGWFQAQPVPPPPPPPQAPPAPRYAAALQSHPHVDSGYHLLPPPPQDAHILQRPMLAWAPPPPPVQQRPGSAQAQAPRVTGKLTFEEFLWEAGILDKQTVSKIIVDEVAEDMLGDGQAERGARFVTLKDVLVALGAVSPSGAGLSTHQVRRPVQEEALGAGAGATGGGGRRHQAAAAEARERRSRRMAKRKEAAAKHAAGIDYYLLHIRTLHHFFSFDRCFSCYIYGW